MDPKREDTDYTTITTVLVFMLTFLLVCINTSRRKRVPPGPALLPIVGNLPSLVTSDMLGTLSELRKQYGDIFGLYAGGKLLVFLNGYETIHDALVKKGSIFMERLIPSYDRETPMHTKGLIFANGKVWKDGKCFTLAALQEICYNDKGFVENLINEEISQLKQITCEFKGPFDIERYLNASVANVVFQVVYGHRFDIRDDELYWFQNQVKAFAADYMKREVILSCFPVLKHVPVDILGIQKTRVTIAKVMDFLDKLIENLKNKINDQSIQKCTYVENYLERIGANKRDCVLDSSFDEASMKIAAYQLIVAGSETVASTIRWMLLYLVRNPEIQERMYTEITRVLGNESPAVADRKRLPYVNAVVLETLRISHVAPLAMPHTVLHDTLFRGYLIPEQCTVIPNLSTALKDPLIWEHPDEFRPERFLNEAGSDITIPKEFIPFSLGPRACLGETLARLEIFLFITGLVQQMRLLPEKDGLLPDTNGKLATTFNADKFKMRVIAR